MDFDDIDFTKMNYRVQHNTTDGTLRTLIRRERSVLNIVINDPIESYKPKARDVIFRFNEGDVKIIISTGGVSFSYDMYEDDINPELPDWFVNSEYYMREYKFYQDMGHCCDRCGIRYNPSFYKGLQGGLCPQCSSLYDQPKPLLYLMGGQ